ncbi:hypothetical protein MK805_03100 [Shimazuella sp. AN120528]|uniref:hypothetical protein n=1 Tax=Shimazuella soli TaxID=1892854 RepID=UPI001F116E8B|nr:hypothetical protein [Shimazuella soli]MCH5583949.1 hypothetical protein [Shimazuella soli]
MSDSIKGVFREVKKGIIDFSFTALRSGAANVGKQLVNVTSDEKQPSSIQFQTFVNALKTGIIGTGEELMAIGLERLKVSTSQEQNSKVSEESTLTKESAEEK